ncbi:MAG: hypothetical protein AAF217_07170 [Pseudomonadota bacterium]
MAKTRHRASDFAVAIMRHFTGINTLDDLTEKIAGFGKSCFIEEIFRQVAPHNHHAILEINMAVRLQIERYFWVAKMHVMPLFANGS